jgi:hypothetical protein
LVDGYGELSLDRRHGLSQSSGPALVPLDSRGDHVRVVQLTTTESAGWHGRGSCRIKKSEEIRPEAIIGRKFGNES